MIGLLRKTIRSFTSSEKMSYARSPRAVVSITIGTTLCGMPVTVPPPFIGWPAPGRRATPGAAARTSGGPCRSPPVPTVQASAFQTCQNGRFGRCCAPSLGAGPPAGRAPVVGVSRGPAGSSVRSDGRISTRAAASSAVSWRAAAWSAVALRIASPPAMVRRDASRLAAMRWTSAALIVIHARYRPSVIDACRTLSNAASAARMRSSAAVRAASGSCASSSIRVRMAAIWLASSSSMRAVHLRSGVDEVEVMPIGPSVVPSPA